MKRLWPSLTEEQNIEVYVKLLDEYSKMSFDKAQQCFVRVQYKGRAYEANYKDVLGICADLLSALPINLLKYKALVGGMKRFGSERLYEVIMGEPIEKAIVE